MEEPQDATEHMLSIMCYIADFLFVIAASTSTMALVALLDYVFN